MDVEGRGQNCSQSRRFQDSWLTWVFNPFFISYHQAWICKCKSLSTHFLYESVSPVLGGNPHNVNRHFCKRSGPKKESALIFVVAFIAINDITLWHIFGRSLSHHDDCFAELLDSYMINIFFYGKDEGRHQMKICISQGVFKKDSAHLRQPKLGLGMWKWIFREPS